MDENDVGGNLGKVKLQPRRPGESIKVAETVLKRRDRNLKAAAQRAERRARSKKSQKDFKKGKLNIIRAEKLVKNARTRTMDAHRLKTQEKKKKPKLQQGAVLTVARNGRMGGTKEVKIALRELGLQRRHQMTFRLNNEETSKRLQIAKPFCFWGVPTFKAVFDIVHKKAEFRDKDSQGGRTVLSDNILIEKHLGDLGVLCTEDLAHVIHTGGKGFKEVMQRLCPVTLGNVKKASGMVHDQYFVWGDLKEGVDKEISKLMGD
eukprot:TRINITY_DN46742_c0_g1_i1.p1 TRINITY_DN46742_c0_g1~~TRINITY_DN46742_c0_g1_i1.p1  ORF type:complete len:286 (-),score=68.86 TRINITY_DN46742_c0_g1_i1:120-905(-)